MARTHGHGNPKWTRDETILALNLYFDCHEQIPSPTDARVKTLSNLLRQLPYHRSASRVESFRNADGVAFKLQNLRSVATGKGLGNVSRTDRQIWSEFGLYPEKVKQLAELIRTGVELTESLQEAARDDEEEFFEGRVLTELHKRRERDPRLRQRILESRRKLGSLTCDMCSRECKCADPKFADAEFEAHHLIPLSTTADRYTRLADIALVCANCHRLLHRAISITKRWLSIEEGRKVTGLLHER
jgi:5-methylcytosine-specific restriction protein A